MQTDNPASLVPAPWWKFAYVWMVIAGPAAVVLAGIVTIYLAVSRPDPVVDADYYRKGQALAKELATHPASLAPAQQGRNHAATGVPLKPVQEAP